MCAAGICRGATSRWTTLGGDVHHSGYNVNETSGPPVALAWQAISDGQLRATDAGSGAFLWTFPGDGVLSYPPVVAGNYVYVASMNVAYAVKPSTQIAGWKGTPGGWLSVAGGNLYVAQPNGTLSAYTLGH